MTHEADTTNFTMSFVDDAEEAAFSASVSKAQTRKADYTAMSGQPDNEIRLRDGHWSVQEKVQWQCGACTFLNQPLFLACEMCGTARPSQEINNSNDQGVAAHDEAHAQGTGRAFAPGACADTSATASLNSSLSNGLTSAEEKEWLAQEEEEHKKQERLKELMALQQGIFNQIKEESEDTDVEELENSFAWMELEEYGSMKSLPPSTVEVSTRQLVAEKAGANKLKGMDDSDRTATTVASSCVDGSSRFSMDFSNSSHHSNHASRRNQRNSLDVSGSSHGSLHSSRRSTRNSAIEQHSLASLKTDESFRESLQKGSIARSANAASSSGSLPGLVQFGALKSPPPSNNDSLTSLGLDIDSSHSIGLGEGSTHSSPGTDASCVSNHTRRHAALGSSISSLHDISEGSKELDDDEDLLPSHAGFATRAKVGGMSSPGGLPPLKPMAKSAERKASPNSRRTSQTNIAQDNERKASPNSRSSQASIVQAHERMASPNSRSSQASIAQANERKASPNSRSPQASIGQAHERMASPNSRSSQANIAQAHVAHLRDSTSSLPRASLLIHEDGASKMRFPSLVPDEVKEALAASNDPIFSRNLYADRNHADSKKKSSGVHIPLLGRVLKKKGGKK